MTLGVPWGGGVGYIFGEKVLFFCIFGGTWVGPQNPPPRRWGETSLPPQHSLG